MATKRKTNRTNTRTTDTPEPSGKVTLRLPLALIRAVKHLGVDTGQDMQDLVAEAVRAYLTTKKGRSRDDDYS